MPIEHGYLPVDAPSEPPVSGAAPLVALMETIQLSRDYQSVAQPKSRTYMQAG